MRNTANFIRVEGTIDEKIADYKKDRGTYVYGKVLGVSQKKPWERYARVQMQYKRLGISVPKMVEWFRAKRPDAKIDFKKWEVTKERNLSCGVAWTRGTYGGYKVTIEVDGDRFVHETSGTYRRNHEILDFMIAHI